MQLGFLADVYATEGPYATVYLQNRAVGEDAASQIGLRWQPLAQRLRAEGADSDTLRALQSAVGAGTEPQGRPGAATARGRALVASGGRVLLNRPLPRLPEPLNAPTLTRDEARWAPLPHLSPLLGHEQRPEPHLLVVADRVGADIHVITDDVERITVVDGVDHPLHKVRAGGWSHRRLQQRAENSWEHNASLVAASVVKLSARHRATLVLLAGDVRARAAICDHLPPAVRRTVVETEHGGRAARAAEQPLREEAARLAADQAGRTHDRLLERFAAERRQAERAAEGLERVIEAVRDSQVDVLLMASGTAESSGQHEQRVWVGAEGRQLALTKLELEGLGVEEYAADRADAALIRACAVSGAAVELLTPDDPAVRDGFAALLRYAVPAVAG